MTKTMLVLFWVMWLLDVLMALLGYKEFILGVFGRNASPNGRYLLLWIALLAIMMLLIAGSIYFKNQGHPSLALTTVAIPMLVALPYALYLGMVIIFGSKTNWR